MDSTILSLKSPLKTFKLWTHSDIRSNSPPPPPLEINHEGITKQLLPFFILLRFFGRCPLKFESGVSCPGEGSSNFKRVTYVYRASWKEQSFILSLLSATFFASSFTFNICQAGELFPSDSVWSGSEILNKRRAFAKITGKLITVVLLTFEIGSGVQGVIEYFLAWVTAPQLAEWLTQWNSIERQLGNYTSSQAVCNLTKFRNSLMLYYIAVPVALMGTMVISNDLDANYLIYSLIMIIYGYSLAICSNAEDVKVHLICKTIEMTFKQVRLQVEERSSNSSWDFELSKSDTIRDWHRLLISIRKQAAVAGKYLATQQLLAIGMSIYFSSSALFVAANIIDKDTEEANIAIPLVIAFALTALFRLVFKISIAVKITEEESRLAMKIKDMELLEKDSESRSELKSIYDLLSSQPTIISLNNYVSLNNSLILSVCGQMLTQFIVFMQFQNPK